MEDIQRAAAAYFFISACNYFLRLIAKESENVGETEDGG
jgi:hypothetical protein